jgi:hypothetical protein
VVVRVMNDFEMVRRSIRTTRKVDGDEEALGRIEAEVEKLRAERDTERQHHADVLRAVRAASEAEVERLQAILDCTTDAGCPHMPEVERLRAALERIAAWPEDTDAVPDSEDYRYWAGWF